MGSSLSLIPEDGLPPILISTGVKGGTGGHITGACTHPHHSAASSLLCQLLSLCLFFTCSVSRLIFPPLIAKRGRICSWECRDDVLKNWEGLSAVVLIIISSSYLTCDSLIILPLPPDSHFNISTPLLSSVRSCPFI